MATKPDLKAQKERKQKIILVVGGVLFLGLLAFQLPKLLSHSSGASTAAPAATSTTTPGAVAPVVPATVPSGTAGAPVNVSASKNSAQLAGVLLSPAPNPAASDGQLWSFSRFKPKDPFVQQVKGTSAEGSPSGSPSKPAAVGGAPGSSGGSAGGPSVVPATPPVVFAYATLLVNGRPQQLTLKDVFPKADPIFVLAKVGDKNARIGVAGGSFTGGQTMLLQLDKRVTLMNTTTGQRYVVKLVYVGAQPETIASFKGGSSVAPAVASPKAPAVAASKP